MIYCDIINCRYYQNGKCSGPKREKLFQQYNNGNMVHVNIACADYAASDC